MVEDSGGHLTSPPHNYKEIMEELANKYYNALDTTPNAGLTLSAFFCEAFNQKNEVDIIKMFNKLVSMYGRYSVFNAILSMYDMPDIDDVKNTYQLLAYFCKKDFMKTPDVNMDLTDMVEKRLQRLEKLKEKKLKIPDPFERKE